MADADGVEPQIPFRRALCHGRGACRPLVIPCFYAGPTRFAKGNRHTLGAAERFEYDDLGADARVTGNSLGDNTGPTIGGLETFRSFGDIECVVYAILRLLVDVRSLVVDAATGRRLYAVDPCNV